MFSFGSGTDHAAGVWDVLPFRLVLLLRHAAPQKNLSFSCHGRHGPLCTRALMAAQGGKGKDRYGMGIWWHACGDGPADVCLSFIPHGQAQKLGDQVEEEEGCSALGQQGVGWCAGKEAGRESSSQESGSRVVYAGKLERVLLAIY